MEFDKEPRILTYTLYDKKSQTIWLNNSGTSYISIDYLPEELETKLSEDFAKIWAIHPVSRHKIIMNEKELVVSRYSKSYGQTWTGLSHIKSSSYMYSGFDTSANNDPVPSEFEPYYSWAKKSDSKFNQVIANWYADQLDYIAPHADCTRGMIPNAKISICSAYADTNPNNFRTIEFRPRNFKSDPVADLVKIKLPHGSVLTICGQTNKYFTHGIPREPNPVCPRVSLSFRQMITD